MTALPVDRQRPGRTGRTGRSRSCHCVGYRLPLNVRHNLPHLLCECCEFCFCELRACKCGLHFLFSFLLLLLLLLLIFPFLFLSFRSFTISAKTFTIKTWQFSYTHASFQFCLLDWIKWFYHIRRHKVV